MVFSVYVWFWYKEVIESTNSINSLQIHITYELATMISLSVHAREKCFFEVSFMFDFYLFGYLFSMNKWSESTNPKRNLQLNLVCGFCFWGMQSYFGIWLRCVCAWKKWERKWGRKWGMWHQECFACDCTHSSYWSPRKQDVYLWTYDFFLHEIINGT